MSIQKIIGIVVLALLLVSGVTIKSLLSSQASPDKKMIRLQPGSIDGQVLDSQGNPVARAKLHVLRVGGNPNGRVIFHWSRDDGRFSIDGLEPGVYDVFVSKEGEDYPDTQMFFYSTKESKPLQAVISEEQPSIQLTVPLGPKAGRITGRVVDAATGSPIDEAVLTFRRSENDKMFLRTSLNKIDFPGGFDFLLPAAPLTIKATAAGYEDWTYRKSDGKQATELLTLDPGQTMQLTIKMKRAKK